MTRTQPDPEKLEKLRAALEDYAAGSSGGALFDHEAEESKAAVRHRALLLLDQRSRSRQELYDRLVAAEFDAEVVESVPVSYTHLTLPTNREV